MLHGIFKQLPQNKEYIQNINRESISEFFQICNKVVAPLTIGFFLAYINNNVNLSLPSSYHIVNFSDKLKLAFYYYQEKVSSYILNINKKN